MRRVTELAAERVKSEEILKREVALLKKEGEERVEDLQFQVRQLQKIVHEKETFENIIAGRVEKVRKEKD